jgi:GDP-4-dehydro-6-deoxy-D-mannose reductase
VRALITGARGFAGTWLARSLEAGGYEVTGLTGDVRDTQNVACAVSGSRPDAIFHLAAVASPAAARTDPAKAMDVATAGTLNVLEAARRHAPEARILIAGSSDEYGPAPGGTVLTEDSLCQPDGPYGAAKLAASELGMAFAGEHGLHVTVTRAWLHTGPGQDRRTTIGDLARHVAAAVRDPGREIIACTDLSQQYDITDVRDVVRAYRAAIALEPGTWNVCSGRVVTLRDILAVILRLAGRPNVPVRENACGERRDMPPGSAAKLRAAAGWQPQIPLEQTLGDLLACQEGKDRH